MLTPPCGWRPSARHPGPAAQSAPLAWARRSPTRAPPARAAARPPAVNAHVLQARSKTFCSAGEAHRHLARKHCRLQPMRMCASFLQMELGSRVTAKRANNCGCSIAGALDDSAPAGHTFSSRLLQKTTHTRCYQLLFLDSASMHCWVPKACKRWAPCLRRRQSRHVVRLLIEVLGEVVVADAFVVHGRQRVDALAVRGRRRRHAWVVNIRLHINTYKERAWSTPYQGSSPRVAVKGILGEGAPLACCGRDTQPLARCSLSLELCPRQFHVGVLKGAYTILVAGGRSVSGRTSSSASMARATAYTSSSEL